MATQSHQTSDAKSQASPNRQSALTIFRNTAAEPGPTNTQEHKAALWQMAEKLKTTHARQKDYLPLWKLARFGDDVAGSPSGKSLRWGGNLKAVSGVEADYDGEDMPMEEAAERCRKAGVNALFYESPSATATRRRWRVMAPFSKEYPPAKRKPLLARLNGFLGNILESESFVDVQAFYYGNVDGTPVRETIIVEGQFLDLVPGVEVYPLGKKPPADDEEYEPSEPGTWPPEKLREMLAFIDPNIGYNDWRDIGFGIHYETGGSDEGFEIFDEWSQGGADYNKKTTTKQIWKDAKKKCDRPATGWTVMRFARAADPPWEGEAPQPTAEELGLEEIVDDQTKTAAGQSPIDAMNARHAVAQIALGKVVVLTFDGHGGHGFSTTNDLTQLYRYRPAPQAKSTKTFGVWWLEHPKRRNYLGGVVFKPGENTEPLAYNLFYGWAVERDADHSKCELILKHVREVLACGDEERADYILNWSAHLVQKPQEKPGVAIGLNGLKGVGKDIYAVVLGLICGKAHYAVVTKMEHLTGRFNTHEQQALLIHCPDAVWGGDRGAVGALNNLITNPVTMIDTKNVPAFNVDSFCRLFLTSNEDWSIPASPDERRWAVFDVSDKYRGNLDYFNALGLEIDGGVPHGTGPGIPAFFDYLMTRDISKFDPRRFPQTEGLARQKENTLSGVDKFIYQLLIEGELPVEGFDVEDWKKGSMPVERANMQLIFEEWHRKQRYAGEIASASRLGMRLHHFIEGLEDTRPRDGSGKPVRTYVFPPLDVCRAQFAEKMGSPVKWPNDPLYDANDLI